VSWEFHSSRFFLSVWWDPQTAIVDQVCDGGVFSPQTGTAILRSLEFPEAHLEGINQHSRPISVPPCPYKFDDLVAWMMPISGRMPARLSELGHEAGGGAWIEAAVTGLLWLAKTLAWPQSGRPSVDVGLAQQKQASLTSKGGKLSCVGHDLIV